MLRFFLMLVDKYGLGILNLALLATVSYKLCTNHLKHILEGVKENKKGLEKIDKKLDGVTERVARLEGKIE